MSGSGLGGHLRAENGSRPHSCAPAALPSGPDRPRGLRHRTGQRPVGEKAPFGPDVTPSTGQVTGLRSRPGGPTTEPMQVALRQLPAPHAARQSPLPQGPPAQILTPRSQERRSGAGGWRVGVSTACGGGGPQACPGGTWAQRMPHPMYTHSCFQVSAGPWGAEGAFSDVTLRCALLENTENRMLVLWPRLLGAPGPVGPSPLVMRRHGTHILWSMVKGTGPQTHHDRRPQAGVLMPICL